MKKLFIFTIVFINSFILYSQRSLKDNSNKSNDKNVVYEIKEVKNIIKLDVGQIFSQSMSFHYERMINKNVSLSLGIIGKYNSISGGFGSISTSQTTSGLGFMPEVRFYAIPDYHAPRGLYLSAFYNYLNEKYEEKGSWYDFNTNKDIQTTGTVNTKFSTFGATIGWMFRIKSSFVVDLGFGPTFKIVESPFTYDIKSSSGTVLNKPNSPNQSSAGLSGILRISLGYAF